MQERPLVTLLALAAAALPEDTHALLERLKSGLRDQVDRDPMDAAISTVLVGSLLFYIAERNENPKVNSFHDALLYCATDLTVGHSQLHPVTPAGKAIGAALMTYGPALVTGIFEPPAKERPAVSPDTQVLVERLDAILAALDRPTVTVKVT